MQKYTHQISGLGVSGWALVRIFRPFFFLHFRDEFAVALFPVQSFLDLEVHFLKIRIGQKKTIVLLRKQSPFDF